MYRRKNYDSHRKHKNKMKIKRRRISRVRFFFVSVYIHFSAAPFVILLGSVYPFAIYYFFFSVFRLWWMRHHCVSLSRRNAMRSLLLPRRAERQKKDTLLLLSSLFSGNNMPRIAIYSVLLSWPSPPTSPLVLISFFFILELLSFCSCLGWTISSLLSRMSSSVS